MNPRDALLVLNFNNIGSIRLGKLMKTHGSLENIFKDKIVAFRKEDLAAELKLVEKLGLDILTINDEEYPRNLKNIPGAPIVLYVKGKIRQEDNLSIGIVGSRQASLYGAMSADKFGFELAQRGITVVSGMARGIDTAAHKGALKAGGRTLAVIGSGFNNIYPADNKKLADEIAQNGAVISEFPINIEPFKQNFPRRNRVISGLSLGILVVEAAQNSGALITADFALEQGRDVFALPGKVDSANSFGTNELIKQGAKLVSCVDDITEELILPAVNSKVDQLKNERPVNLESPEESRLYSLITMRSVELDELVEKTRMNIPRISDALLKLQMKKLIRQLPGKQFVRSR